MFWLIIIALCVLACLFVLFPLLRFRSEAPVEDRNQINVELYRERLSELQEVVASDEIIELEAKKDLLSDTQLPGKQGISPGEKKVGLLLVLLIPVMALLVYSDLGLGRGAIADFHLSNALQNLDQDDEVGYQDYVKQVQARADQKPNDTDIQFLLARTYTQAGEFDRAAEVFGVLTGRFPMDPNLASNLAEVLFLAEGRKISEQTSKAIEVALKLNPSDITMLEIMGLAAMSDGKPEEARTWFLRALHTGVSGRRAELIRGAIAQLPGNSLISENAGANVPGEVSVATPEKAPAGRVLNVSVKATDRVSVPAGATVFVYARAASGPPAPLAIARFVFRQLPVQVRLDESMAMIPGMGLANFDEIVVIARVSLSGDVKPSPGDYEARSETINLSQNNGGDERQVELVVSDQL
jgi:cytochrome c-type biogenesis protein CcmH